jgi:RNA polymerase sigma factor (sigma-70 family)
VEREFVGTAAESSATSRLLRAYHERGDATARARLVELYLPLVESLVRRHSRGSDDYEDLYQVGCIGLINAIDRFDVQRGDELAAFAVPNIAGEIRRYLRDRADSVRLPRRVLELRGAAARAQRELSAGLGRTPTTAEIAAEIGADEADAALALDAVRASSALELTPDADPAAAEEGDDRLFIAEAFRGLDERERRIVYLRYYRDMPPREVARQLGLSERQISRAARTALAKLRGTLEGAPAGPSPRKTPAKSLPQPESEPKMASMGGTPSVGAERQSQQGYHLELVRGVEPGSGWTAQVEEIPGCEGQGATPDDAVREAEAAMARWIAEAEAAQREVPKPRAAATHSGRLMVRMPQSLHGELAQAAQREDVSLNQFITGALAAAVHWRAREGTTPSGESSSSLRRVLLINLVVLAIVGVAALILLVVALT